MDCVWSFEDNVSVEMCEQNRWCKRNIWYVWRFLLDLLHLNFGSFPKSTKKNCFKVSVWSHGWTGHAGRPGSVLYLWWEITNFGCGIFTAFFKFHQKQELWVKYGKASKQQALWQCSWVRHKNFKKYLVLQFVEKVFCQFLKHRMWGFWLNFHIAEHFYSVF